MEVVQKQQAKKPVRAIGAILVDSGFLKPEQVQQVLRLQDKYPQLRFGDAALRLGYVDEVDVQQALAKQFVYPYLSNKDELLSTEAVAAYKPFSNIVEQLRALRSQLLMRWFNSDIHKALAIVSPAKGDGKSFIAANLAIVFSQLGQRTLLIDADLRQSRQHEIFKLENKVGLSTLLAGRTDLANSYTAVKGLLSLSVIPAGPTPPNPHELLSRAAFRHLISACRNSFDVIILDTPTGIEYPDTLSIAAQTQGALLVANKNRSSVTEMQDLQEQLSSNGITMVGSIFNKK